MLRERVKAQVGREDRDVHTLGDRRNQKIGGRTGDSGRPASIEMLRRPDMVVRSKRLVGKSGQSISQALKLSAVRNSRENLLSNDAEEDNPSLSNQLLPSLDDPILSRASPTGFPPKGE